jgi:predicted Fe-Mo cluster-binding NifX family protein
MSMSKIAFTTLLQRDNSALSPHFGKAKWVLIFDRETGHYAFEQNTGLNGRAVVEIMARHGCSDAVFTQIGSGALQHLHAAGIRGWIGPAYLPVPELLKRLDCGELVQVEMAPLENGRLQRG